MLSMLNISEIFLGLTRPAKGVILIRMKVYLIALIGLMTTGFSVYAQNNREDSNGETGEEGAVATDKRGDERFWEANLAGGNYMVALGRISSVSRHEYVLDGAVIVDEVTVDTTGQALVRFYHISPITSGAGGSAAAELADRALGLANKAARTTGTKLQDMVVKKYPVTTHSKTIEYRLLSEQQLDVLYQSVKTAWRSGKGRVFTGR